MELASQSLFVLHTPKNRYNHVTDCVQEDITNGFSNFNQVMLSILLFRCCNGLHNTRDCCPRDCPTDCIVLLQRLYNTAPASDGSSRDRAAIKRRTLRRSLARNSGGRVYNNDGRYMDWTYGQFADGQYGDWTMLSFAAK